MAKYLAGLVGFLALMASISAPAALQKDRASPPGREEAIFEFLLAELSAQRGESGTALESLARLARELRDPKVARRAVELAIRARAPEPALELAILLVELEPDSPLGRDLVASLVSSRGDVDKARELIEAIVEKSPDRPFLLTQLAFFFGKYPDKAAVLEATRKIASRHPKLAESHYAMGVAALLADRLDLAMAESKQTLEMRPAWSQGAILHAQVLKKEKTADVIAFYSAFVERNPGSHDVRLQLARELATVKRLAEAREQFRAAERLSDADPQVPYAIGLLGVQLEDYADADLAFRRALFRGYADPGAVYIALGQAAEAAKQFDQAREWYEKVDMGDRMRAQMRIAALIAKRDGLEKGRAYLREVDARTPEERIQTIQIEAQLLRDAKAWKETFDLLTEAVKQFPDAFELLYDRAMAAERVDRLDVLEADLRRVIELKPDYAHAYNALGYSLADRTDRIEEAFVLIEKAIKLAPEDPFILDSMGWVQYRRGKLNEALKDLQRAYEARPDPEIAAHLGEVLWMLGRKAEAGKVWKSALSDNPDHETLLAVIQKFKP